MMANPTYATIEDVELLWRPLTDDEKLRCEPLLEIISDSLREEAHKVHKDLDAMIEADSFLVSVAKSVTVDVVGRTLMTSTRSEPMTQYSQSALGYTMSGSYLVPGGGLFIKKTELARLGIRNQQMGTLEIYDFSGGDSE